MKKFLFPAIASALLIASSAKAVIVGNSFGYLLDHKQPYLTARVGGKLLSSSFLDHIAELEIGGTTDSEAGIKTSLLPVTLNYRALFGANNVFSGYLGVGAGMAYTQVRGFGEKAENWLGAGQAFGGVSLKLFGNASLDLGARYIRVNETEHFGRRSTGGEDTIVEAGIHFVF
jgi:opacity protein-like surface antigen